MTDLEPDEPDLASMSEWSRTVLDAAMDAVIMIDQRGRVVYWSPSAATLFGRSWSEVSGQDMAEMIIPPELRNTHQRAFNSSTIGAAGSILGRRIEVVGQRKDGSRFPVELTVTRTDRDDTHLYTGYLRDITERHQMLDELRDSRSRLVEVSDQTRRRIERDLHDGAQQQLVGAAMIVAQARDRLGEDPSVAAELLDRASDVLVQTITEIRELARGVLPRVLSDHGLAPALAELGRRSPIPTQIDALPDRWPPTVEMTLYFVAAEALTNAIKYGANTVQVGIRTSDSEGGQEIVCVVSDDGPGGADASRGSGLVGLRDRLAAVAGTLEVHSPPGAGTVITARIHTPGSARTDKFDEPSGMQATPRGPSGQREDR